MAVELPSGIQRRARYSKVPTPLSGLKSPIPPSDYGEHKMPPQRGAAMRKNGTTVAPMSLLD